jgi:hypothetical protein
VEGELLLGFPQEIVMSGPAATPYPTVGFNGFPSLLTQVVA